MRRTSVSSGAIRDVATFLASDLSSYVSGQRVEVVVAQADLARRQLDFALDEPEMKRPEPRRALRRY